MQQPPLKNLCQKLGHHFSHLDLLEAALTHRSARGLNNERLEFLGDSIVNFVIAEALYHAAPKASEGELSRLRASLVRGETLAQVAQEFELGNYLRLGAGELKSGGFRRQSILADALEAVIAAIYLDAGLDKCIALIQQWFQERLQRGLEIKIIEHKDPKSRLQEYLQSKKLGLPLYEITATTGEAHAQTFYVRCSVEGLALITEGVGNSRRIAEQNAAEQFLEQLNHV